MSSRTIIANKQRNSSYRPNYAMPAHVARETQVIDSTEKVVELNGSYWVKSWNERYQNRYYRVVIENGAWFCSASDERVARMCKQEVEAYIATLQPPTVDNGEIQIASKSKPGTFNTLYIRNGKAAGCTCDQAKAIHIEKYNWKPCDHMKKYNEQAEKAPQVQYNEALVA